MWLVQVTRVETAAVVSDTGCVTAENCILEQRVKVTIQNLSRLPPSGITEIHTVYFE